MGERFTSVNGSLPFLILTVIILTAIGNMGILLLKVSVYTKIDFLRCMHVGVIIQVK